MKKAIFVILILFVALLNGHSQNNLDILLASLNNKDLYIAPIIRGNNIGVAKKNVNKDSLLSNRPISKVTSLNEDVQTLAKKYSKEVLIKKLYALLQDTARDFYANALLYDLLDNCQLGKLSSFNRAKWMQSGKRSTDIEYWRKYLKREKYIE